LTRIESRGASPALMMGGIVSHQALIEQIVASILNLDGDTVNELVQKALDQKADLTTLINDGLTVGLRKLGERFENGQVFIPELMWGAEMVQQNLKALEPYIERDTISTKGKLLIGSVEGDIHDVGKNIVCSVFSAAGYKVIDLGIDVTTETFVQKVREEKPALLGLSALLTTTMLNQRKVVEALEAEGLRQDVKVIIGGAPTSGSWARTIRADAYAEDVFSGLTKAERLLG